MKIDEIFGPTIAGEGSIAGAVTMFVRTGGCDYRCAWCDTMHAVDPTNAPLWSTMTPDEVANRIDGLADGLAPGTWVSISGGNPAIWQHELPVLVLALQKRGYRVNIETQGSVPNEAFRDADTVTFSPKPPSAGVVTDHAKLAQSVLLAQARAVLKFVIGSDEDFAFALAVADAHPFTPVYVQPLTINQTFPGYRSLCERVAATQQTGRWRVIPQLHVLAWGNERGR